MSVDEREKLTPFLFPILANTPKLMKFGMQRLVNQQRASRKEQVQAVVRDLVSLVALGRQRYKWLSGLDAQILQVAEATKTGQATLPAVIKCRDFDNREELTFRIWCPRPSYLTVIQPVSAE